MTIPDFEEPHIAEQKKQAAAHQTSIPKTIQCPKCRGSNRFSNIRCSYCRYQFKEKDYFDAYSMVNLGADSDASKGAGGRLWGGLLLAAGGAASIVYGYLLEHRLEFQRDFSSGNGANGTAWMIAGIAAAVAGLFLLISAFFRREK